MHRDVQRSFALAIPDDFTARRQAETVEKGHGHIETRPAWVIVGPAVVDWLQERHAWPGLRAIRMVNAGRLTGTERSREHRYYLLSRPVSATASGNAVRRHWGIENRVHWILDLTFHEDQRRIRAGHAAENFVVLRHIALHLLQRQQTKRLSIKARRKKAGGDNAYLLQILRAT